MGDTEIRREQLRTLLEQAQVEIGSALERVDAMGTYELAEWRGASSGIRAIFDKNGVCAADAFDDLAFFDKNGVCSSDELRRFDPVAFFDKNGTCAADLKGGFGRVVRGPQ